MSEILAENSDKQQEFDAEQNLLGVFSVLLAVDKRINPQNYVPSNVNQND